MIHLNSVTRRRGMALLGAIVLLAVLTIILSVVTLQVVAQRKLVAQRERQFQAEWLARAGTELAAAKLLQNGAAFKDDKQTLVPDSKLRIVVEKTAADLFTVSVEARVGSEQEQPVVRSAKTQMRRSEKDGQIQLRTVSASAH